MRQFVKIAFVAIFAAVAGYGVYTSQKSEVMSDLAMANVEALAQSEATTSWTCDGWWGDCSAFCGTCSTKIEGDGSLKGTHSCSSTKK